jgi:hypothetical protein
MYDVVTVCVSVMVGLYEFVSMTVLHQCEMIVGHCHHVRFGGSVLSVGFFFL